MSSTLEKLRPPVHCSLPDTRQRTARVSRPRREASHECDATDIVRVPLGTADAVPSVHATRDRQFSPVDVSQ